jgi:hypothetical protein
VDGAIALRLRGALLWTHVGVSGPVVLDASRHWARAELEGRRVELTLSFCPGETFDSIDRRLTQLAGERPRATIMTGMTGMTGLKGLTSVTKVTGPTTFLPAAVVAAVLDGLAIPPDAVLAHLPRATRRRLAHGLTSWPLHVSATRGYTVAEATAGGVALDEIDPATMESRVCPGLYLVGEMLDVDGRIGGFNFQWAWSSARAAARGLSRPHPSP